MQSFIRIVLESGKSAVDLTLYVLLPIMALMMAVMRLLEAKGILAFVARLLAPVLRPFGVPGMGVFAMLQLLFVGFAAPATTLDFMEQEGISKRGLAATLAMILAMSQANAVFPLLDVGLSFQATLLTSLLGGFAASAVTYYLLVRSDDDGEVRQAEAAAEKPERPPRLLELLTDGGIAGMRLCLRSFPILLLALCLVKTLEVVGSIAALERGLSPLAQSVGLPGIAVLPIATKYLAGGTAMLGVTRDLIHAGSMSARDLNRVAGFMINPLDLVGVPFLLSATGTRVKEIAWQAMAGAAVGILIRGLLHLVLF